jgi:HIRAN domain
MNEEIRWLLRLSPIWIALVAGVMPALIAGFKRRPMTRWYLYGFVSGFVSAFVPAFVAWPLIALPMIHALLVRRQGTPEQVRQRQRRADALALLGESSVRSYPSSIAQLRRKSPTGINRRHYVYEHIGPGEPLELVREPANQTNDHAVAYHHHGVHLGYVPKRQRWIAEALDDGLRLTAIAEKVKNGWIFRRRTKFVGTRIVVLYDGR